ncbi:SAP30-binding protein [Zootermopsis nevadensis]|uniref:SAP30-binding protein n=1 Tax=Zootermopsis nevadensis TaxID=136037 RepID=A0A067RAL8_ZOONE|nr:SAP30-binding protein [Zootermopsis nevadensis]XP_021925014.1 SAP30-binding protein [Zootermopsis nevadensis]XP_021925015.1 SAP30-binding protein [Zootermopsis nevadensis]KDR16701.1 SAP30-binding protein [Zootermopsis nevadensis]
MSSQSFALASLTATYTDSEGEEDALEDDNEKSPNDDSSLNSNTPNIVTPPIPSIPPRLVSYHDDTVISDDEGVPGEGSEQERQKAVGNEGDTPDGVHLPPEPTGLCSTSLQDKINRLYEKMESNGLDMNYVIQQRKDFRNPSIYEKLIQFCSINEFGTNYPAQTYDPLRWGKESFYEELARVQKTEMDRREKERKDKTKVEFVSGTAKRPGSGSGAEDDTKRRKSKWDQVGTMVASNMAGGAQAGHILKPAGLLQQPSLTTSVTGTKGTVISAFGSLPKKPRI